MSNIGNKETMAKNLAYYVERSGRTQKELAEVAGVAASTFNDWMKGKKYPRIDKIERLANYFGVLKSDLIEEKEKPTDNDGLTKSQRDLIEFAKGLSEDEAAQLLQTVKLLVQGMRK
jgi:transcriptional regulator with XRE-family HTH domain